MKLQTTLNIIRAAKPCADGWAKLLKSLPSDIDHDAKIDFSHILESNGLEDTLWGLRCVLPEQEKERDREARLLACDYAENVLPLFEKEYPNDKRPRECIEVARRFANGKVTRAELAAAGDAAWAAWADARDAAWAAWAAWDAARAAGADAARAVWVATGAAAGARDAARADEKEKQIKQFKQRFCE
jgi:hypothetical protein